MDVYEARLQNLRALADQAGGRPELAKRLDMAYTLLSNYIGPNPTKRIGDKVARRAEAAFGHPPGWLDSAHSVGSTQKEQPGAILDGYTTVPGMTPASADQYTLVPRLSARGSCGGGADNGDEVEDLKPLAFDNDWLRQKGVREPVVINANGDSMSPLLLDGDVVLFDRARRDVVSGRIYLIQHPDGLRIKRIQREIDGSVWLRSDNPDKVRFPDERVPAEIVPQLLVVGAFVWRGGG